MRARDDFTDFRGNVLFGYPPAFNSTEQLARLVERGLLEFHEEPGGVTRSSSVSLELRLLEPTRFT